jgi:hypothetical protein
MGRLTPEKKKQIMEIYQQHLQYEKTAREADVSWQTVKKIVFENRQITDLKESGMPTVPAAGIPSQRLSPHQLKMVFAELDRGLTPPEIVKKHGFQFKAVEREWQNYTRYKANPALRKISQEILSYLAANAIPELEEFVKIFEERKTLTEDQIIELLSKSDELDENLFTNRRNRGETYPDDWIPISCTGCKQMIAFINPMDEHGKNLLEQVLQGAKHIKCPNRGMLGRHKFL